MAIQMSHNAWQLLQPSRLRPKQSDPKSEHAIPATPDPTTPSPFARKPLPWPKDSVIQVDVVRDPEVVDSIEDQSSAHATRSPRTPSRVSSRYSTIFDLYARDNTPVHSPELPSAHDIPSLPKVDKSLGRFDFGLPSIDATPARVSPHRSIQRPPDAKPGAQEPLPYISRSRLDSYSRHQYSLFPTVSKSPATIVPMAQAVKIIPACSGQVKVVAPGTSPRPCKDSMPASYSGRKYSFNTCHSTAPIPLRLLQSPAMASWSPGKDRWSDESISAPSTATTSRPRTSSSETPRTDSGQYPLSFFEDDDDEGAPLRRKLGWTRASSSSFSRGDDKTKSARRRVVSALLCCCTHDDE